MKLILGAHLASVKSTRAAVLPYTIKKDSDKIYFLLAIDKPSGELTDMGGGVRKNEVDLVAALREFREESNEIFGGMYNNPNDYTTKVGLITRDMSVIFVPVDEKWYNDAPILFESKKEELKNKRCYGEVSGLVWLDQDEFRALLSRDGGLWNKLRRFYRVGFNVELLEALRIVY